MRELKELPKGKVYSIWIPCVCKKGYESKDCKRFYKCPTCGHVWDLAPWIKDIDLPNVSLNVFE